MPPGASGYNYAGAWAVSSPAAAWALQAEGFNVMHIFATPPSRTGGTTAYGELTILAAITPGNYAIVDLTPYTTRYERGSWGNQDNYYATLDYIVNVLMPSPDYSKILGYLTFDEPNVGKEITKATVDTQHLWYRVIKSVDPSRWIFVDYSINECGIPTVDPSQFHPDPDARCSAGTQANTHVMCSGGYAYDSVMVNFYPYHYGWTDAVGESRLRSAVAWAAQFFHPSTWVWAINQASYRSTPPPDTGDGRCGSVGDSGPWLRQHYDLSQQYESWKVPPWGLTPGLMDNSHGVFYYGWSTNPEDKNLSTDPTMLNQAGIMVSQHKSYFP
jgi:hypothetical protein